MPNKVRSRLRSSQAGFTLIELLVVITILGILAAVVVFSVGGIGDRGNKSACKSDYVTLQTAQEAFFARAGQYGSMDQLTGAAPVNGETIKILSTASRLYNTDISGTITAKAAGDQPSSFQGQPCVAPPAD